MKILIACEESQTVAIAFRNKGFEAYSCDIVDCSGGHPEWHIKNDAIVEAYSGGYDLMIAHPPCTYLSNAGARWMYAGGKLNEERLKMALDAKEFFLKLLHAPIKYIAVENPLPLRIVNLPKETQIIQPYMFGHGYSKRTHLWLKNLPSLVATNIIKEHKPYLPTKSQNGKHKHLNRRERSKTFTGIAEAMACQWGSYIISIK